MGYIFGNKTICWEMRGNESDVLRYLEFLMDATCARLGELPVSNIDGQH